MEEVTGTVEKINPKGLRISGKWYNYSKFMQKDAPKLNEGDEIKFDANGDWIVRFKPLSRESIREPLDTNLKESGPNTQPEAHSKEFDKQSTLPGLQSLTRPRRF